MNRPAEKSLDSGHGSTSICEVDLGGSDSRQQRGALTRCRSKRPEQRTSILLKQTGRAAIYAVFVAGTTGIFIAPQTTGLRAAAGEKTALASRLLTERQIAERQILPEPGPDPENILPGRFQISSRFGDCVDRAMTITLPAIGRLGNWYFFQRPDGISKKQMRQAGLHYDPVAKQWLVQGRTHIRLQIRTPKQATALCRSYEDRGQTSDRERIDCLERARTIELPAIGRLGNWYFFQRPEGVSKKQMRQAGLQYDPVAKQWMALGQSSVRVRLRTLRQAAAICR